MHHQELERRGLKESRHPNIVYIVLHVSGAHDDALLGERHLVELELVRSHNAIMHLIGVPLSSNFSKMSYRLFSTALHFMSKF